MQASAYAEPEQSHTNTDKNKSRFRQKDASIVDSGGPVTEQIQADKIRQMENHSRTRCMVKFREMQNQTKLD